MARRVCGAIVIFYLAQEVQSRLPCDTAGQVEEALEDFARETVDEALKKDHVETDGWQLVQEHTRGAPHCRWVTQRVQVG
jgi:hypothetical protein